MQEVLAAAVALLGAELRGVGAAVQLEVELAVPDRGIGILGPCPVEELLRGAELDLRGALEVRGAAPGGHHLAGGPATPVAPAEEVDADAGAALLLEVALEIGELLAGEHPVVGVRRREVGEHAGPVEALPAEGVVGEGVDLVPGDLLGEEVVLPGERSDLRQRGGVAEGVRQPGLPCLDPELLEEEPLAGDELAGHGLGAGHVRVRLDPHAAHRHEAPGGDVAPDAGEQLRVAVLQPGELLGRGGGEGEVRIALQQCADGGEGARHLADGLPHGPQPGGVDVGVAGGENGERGAVRRALEHRSQHVTGGVDGAGQVIGIGGVAGGLERPQDLVAPLAGLRQGDHEADEGAHVLGELPDPHVAAGQPELADRVELLLGNRGEIPERGGREGPVAGDHRVRGAFEVVVQLLPRRHRQIAVKGVDRLHGHAVGSEDQRLCLEAGLAGEGEVDDQLGGAGPVVRPVRRDRAGRRAARWWTRPGPAGRRPRSGRTAGPAP